MKKIKVFVVLGLGDNMGWIGRLINLPNVVTRVFSVGWRKPTTNPKAYFESRLSAFLSEIDHAYAEGYEIVLIGTSAGGSFVVTAFSQRPFKISRVINLSGRLTTIKGPVLIDIDKYKQTDPVFMESVRRSEAVVKNPSRQLKEKFLAFVPFWDELVPIRSMYFDGAKIQRVWFFEHMLNIALVFTLGRRRLQKEIRGE